MGGRCAAEPNDFLSLSMMQRVTKEYNREGTRPTRERVNAFTASHDAPPPDATARGKRKGTAIVPSHIQEHQIKSMAAFGSFLQNCLTLITFSNAIEARVQRGQRFA